MKKLVLKADDFGASKSINKGIYEAYKEGILSSVSTLVNFDGFEEAVKFAKKNKMDVGLHINLTEGKSLTECKSLTSKKGDFNYWFFLKAVFGLFDKKELEKEIEAQFLKLSKNVKVTHVDGHHYIHVFPFIINSVLYVMKKNKVNIITIPHERLIKANRGSIFTFQFIKKIGLDIFSFFARKKVERKGIRYPKDFFGLLQGGNVKEDNFINTINSGRETIEFALHPGYGKFGRDYLNREEELKVLRSKKVKNCLKNVKVVGFGDLYA